MFLKHIDSIAFCGKKQNKIKSIIIRDNWIARLDLEQQGE